MKHKTSTSKWFSDVFFRKIKIVTWNKIGCTQILITIHLSFYHNDIGYYLIFILKVGAFK